jgi:LmbE family N-acetylglucosaminyl deacetylase
MRLFDPDPKLRWAFCMTHPDDEISICAWIHRLALNGHEVFLSWTHSRDVREREARAVAHLLGVPSRNLMFFNATDGCVCEEIPSLVPRFRTWFDEIAPDRVCCGAFEQGHIDHDATNYIVNHAFDGPVLEVPFYHTYLTRFQTLNRFSDPRGEEIRELERYEQILKTTIARQYPSQNIWSILLWYELSQNARLRPMVLAKTERMRLQTHFEWLRPNHPPRLAARVERSPAWARWMQAMGSRSETIRARRPARTRRRRSGKRPDGG